MSFPPPRSLDEPSRLHALRRLGILDTPAEERFDRITRTAARVFEVPIALVSLLDENRLWFKSCIGLPVRSTDRSGSFCAHAVAARQTLVVEDAQLDPRFSDNPLVTDEPRIRFYAGHPIASADGNLLGTLSISSPEPRRFPEHESMALADLAAWAEVELNHSELSRALVARRESERSLQGNQREGERRVQGNRREDERRLKVVMESVGDAILAVDEFGSVVSVNPAADRMFGLEEGHLVGTDVSTLVDGLGGEESVASADFALRELVGRRSNGDPFPLEIRSTHAEFGERWLRILVGRDVTERKESEQRYGRLVRQTNGILDSAGEGIVGMDKDGGVTFANRAASQTLGFARDELVGRRLHPLVHHSHADGSQHPWAECPISSTLSEGAVARIGDEVFWRRDGTSLPVEYVSTPVLDENGEVTGAVVVFSDITERRALEELKDRFVSTVSHELRTPLTSILGYTEALLEEEGGPLTEEQREFAKIAYRNAERLRQLIGDLLLLSRLESVRDELHMEPVLMHELLDAVLTEFAPVARSKDIELAWDIPRPLDLQGSYHRLKQVVANLLSNAIKFSPSGTLVTTRARAEGGELLVEVEDQGPGVPAAELANLGERFFRSSTAGQVEGTGLGLAISREILQQHGGQLEIESVEGEGATFRLRVPRGA